MKRFFAAALAVCLAYGLGCSDSESSEENAGADAAALEASYRKWIKASCECEFYRNGASVEMCVEARLTVDGSSSCEQAAVSHPEAADTLTCASEGWQLAADCVAEGPCDIDHWDGCLDEYIDYTRDCEWPDAVEDDLEACPDPESFECVGGGSVDSEVMCDGYEDCEDGSDEIPC